MSDTGYQVPDEAYKAAIAADQIAGVTHSHRSALRMALAAAAPHILDDLLERTAVALEAKAKRAIKPGRRQALKDAARAVRAGGIR